jgi:UrcA family protein
MTHDSRSNTTATETVNTRENTMTLATTTLNHSRRRVTIGGLAAALLLGAAAAYAASPDAARSVRVAYGDLNLASAQGASTLHARIAAAARSVCGADNVDIRNLSEYAAARSCETQAIANAVRDVHNSRVLVGLVTHHGQS